jgi:hypothetical protein
MQSWKQESIFAEFVDEEDLLFGPFSSRRASVDASDRQAILASTIHASQQLARVVEAHEAESFWATQLLEYLHRLNDSSPAQTPDEQYSHLYILRKWLFWIPTVLLQGPSTHAPAMLVLSHFYATAIALEPLYPELGPAFCARIALPPLEQIISVTDAMQQSQQPMDPNAMELAALMHFPQQVAINFRNRVVQPQQLAMHHQNSSMVSVTEEPCSFTGVGNLSPSFAPAPLHLSSSQAPSSSSSYLEVPNAQSAGFTYGTSGWGAVPSPGFPPTDYTQEDPLYECSMGGFRGGFVPSPAPVWT